MAVSLSPWARLNMLSFFFFYANGKAWKGSEKVTFKVGPRQYACSCSSFLLLGCYGLFSSTGCVNSKLTDSCSVPLSKAGLDLVQDCLCALEKEMLSVCVGSSGTTLVLPHSGGRGRREVNSGKELTWRETSRL